MKIKIIYNSKELSNLIDLDVLVSILRSVFIRLEPDSTYIKISYIQLLKHLSFASSINKDRIKAAFFTLMSVAFELDGLEKTPIISQVNISEKEDYYKIYFHPKVLLALKRGYIFDGLDYMPLQINNKETKERTRV